jgi:predicted phage terminase large subunit-like protein
MTQYMIQTPTDKQFYFLSLSSCLEVFFGGAVGGGKSSALLLAALQYVDFPKYSALLLRRTYSDLALPGALMDRAYQWLVGTDAHWNNYLKTWTFPSGATLTFGYLDSERAMYRYQGSDFQYVGYDEVGQFQEYQYLYLFSRLRRLEGSNVPLRMRAASNPGGVGHNWVKERFIKGGSLSRIYVPARLSDNPYIDKEKYLESLMRLNPVTRAQLLWGDWDVSAENRLAKREWFPIVEATPREGRRVRYWDLAATERSVNSPDPDWCVGTLLSMLNGIYYVEHVVRGRYGPNAVAAIIKQTAEVDGKTVPINIEREGAASGKLYSAALVKFLAGWPVRADSVTGDKVQRAMPFLAQAEAGNVKLVRGAWNVAWLDEVSGFPPGKGGHDDQVDSVSGAFNCLMASGPIEIWENPFYA